MTFKKHLVVPVVALTLIGGTLLAAHSVQAETVSNSFGFDSIVQKIAQKFNLNEADVKAVFDEQHAEMEKQMQAKMEAELNTAVSEGKLTQEQKEKIVAKRAELRASHGPKLIAIKDGEKPSEEELQAFKAEREAEVSELKTWAQENNVPFEYLMPKMFMHRVGGPGMGGPIGEAGAVSVQAE